MITILKIAYERYISAVAAPGDVLIAISTSGNSVNVVNAAPKAREIEMQIIVLTGQDGGLLKPGSDLLINILSEDTRRIQEAHILIGHIICKQVERALFDKY